MRVVLVVVVAGCSFAPHGNSSGGSDGSSTGDAPGSADAFVPPDAPPPDAPRPDAILGLDAGEFCIGPAGWAVCLPSAPSSAPVIPASIDTDSDPNCANPTPVSWTARQDDACVIIGDNIGITGNLAVKGHRPLVIAASLQIVMNQNLTIDVAGHEATPNQHAPGAPFAQCVGPATKPKKDTSKGSGGGAGGTFMTMGGAGGSGNNGGTAGGTPGPADTAPVKLRAGCDGQSGGDGSGDAAPGGNGGGALYLVSNGDLSLQNVIIDAAGGGAAGGGHLSGGSGGGAGGMVVLFAGTTMQVGGLKVVANGGGGSSGGDNNGAGRAGADPVASSPSTPAAGGGTGAGAVGGNGYALGSDPKKGGDGASSKAGGGGGGGAGYVMANQSLGTAITSPATSVIATFPVP